MLRICLICLALLGAPSAVVAQSIESQMISQLTDQGFDDLEITRTLLGRVRIIGYSDTYRRELVFNPATGEILRDYLVAISGTSRAAPRLFDPSDGSGGNSGTGGGGTGSGGDDDDTDDDTDDDIDEDDGDDGSDDDDEGDED